MDRRVLALLVGAAASIMSGCSASSKMFYANPSKVGDTRLCRTFLEAHQKGNDRFAQDTAREAIKRGLSLDDCYNKVAAEDAAIVGIAVVATGVAVAAACQNGWSSGGYRRPSYIAGNTDYDCFGGSGDGPMYVHGPFPLTGPDIYGLDADHDGMACEPYDDIGS